MAENEEKIEYSSDELQEIDRIVNYISQETSGRLPTSTVSPHVDMSDRERDHEIPGEVKGIQFEDMDFKVSGKYKDIPEETEIQEQELEEEQKEIQDITDIIHEIKEKKIEEIPEETFEEIPSKDISLAEESIEQPSFETETVAEEDILKSPEAGKKDKIQEIPEETIDMDLLVEDLEPHIEEEPSAEEIDKITPKKYEPPRIGEEEKEPLIDEDALKEFELDEVKEIEIEETQPATLKDKTRERETLKRDAFDLELEGISPTEEMYPKIPKGEKILPEEEEIPSFDFNGLQTTKAKPEEEITAIEDVLGKIPEADLSSDLDKITEFIKEEEPAAVSPDIEIGKPIEEDISLSLRAKEEKTEEEIELSDNELKKLNKIIQLFHPALTKVIKDVILNDLLPGQETRQLVDMLLRGNPEEDVKDYLENRLNKKIDISVKGAVQRRRVIAARPEYTKEGHEKQVRLYKFSGIFVIAALAVSLITIFSYKYIYIPLMAKRNIDEGVLLIKKPGVPVLEKQRDYKKAEEIFNYVNDNYIKDYLYGYHSYAKAYFQKKEYDYSLEKLNKAYEIDAYNIDTLNNLGFFYAKIPETKFEQIKPELQKYYYKRIKPVGPIDKQIDVAIDFYRKALNIDPKNITALYGIGNAYTYQGEYLKAKQFYENILTVDKESITGYSGLLNLYIERNALPEVISLHSDLKYKEKLSHVPSALLAKLASYYLSKKRTGENNIRIDYGIQSSLFKDFDDNPYPAVKNVLDALTARDINYPPLFVQFARLSKEENNLNLMKRNLSTALEKEPNYFAAHLLLAEYYYQTNDPVEAYKSCKNALQAYLSPPEFTNDDFYFETEKIGTAYAIMGNIFYYFDKMRSRFGDEFEEENAQEKSDELANYSIARDKYEKALAENYKSSEVFYNLGRIYYIKGQYDKAATTWLNLYEDFTAQPELMFALGNAFYHQNDLEAGKGEYLKVISIFENKADDITHVIPDRAEHIKIYQTLSSAYNNLGAIYQIQNSESKSNISYWKAIDYAKKIDKENEFARVNLAKALKSRRENVLPILDENIAANIDVYRQSF